MNSLQKHEKHLEEKVLLNFLKSNLTTRQLDAYLGHDPALSKGWTSWKILKKYNLKTEDRGILFTFRTQECKKIISEIIKLDERNLIERILYSARPRHLEKYSDTYIIADSHEKVLSVLSGEVRNITQSFFNPLKKIVGSCQYMECENTNLDTVHLKSSRPEIFMDACEYAYDSVTEKYSVYELMKEYLQLHSKKRSVCFLCKKHHNKLGKYEKIKGTGLKKFWSEINVQVK